MAPKPKPAVLTSRFTDFQKKNPLPVTKSKAPKPASTGKLQNDQVKKVSDPVLDTWKSSLDALNKAVKGTNNTQPATTTDPSSDTSSGGGNQKKSKGGGGCGGFIDDGKRFKEIRCHTGCGGCQNRLGCRSKNAPRLQYGVYNGSTNVDFTVTVKIPENYVAKETATLQVGGAEHKGGCDTTGYKGYVGINGDKNGFETETGAEKNYGGLLPAKCDSSIPTLRAGEQHTLRMTRTNVNGGVQLQTYVDGKPHCSYLDSPGLVPRKGVNSKCPAIDQLRIDNWPEPEGTDTKYAISVSSPNLG